MPNRVVVTLKVLVHLACAAPLAWLGWTFFQNRLSGDPTTYVTHFTGFGALRLLVLSLAVTPVRRLVPGLGWLARFRRLLGLYAFLYATLHLAIYVSLFAGLSWAVIVDDLAKHRYVWMGLAAWLLLLPLALTSSAPATRALGGRTWQRLHRIVYLAAFAALVHAWWTLKPGDKPPVPTTVVFFSLMAARLLMAWFARKLKRPLSKAPAAAVR